jgi:hypothetical protein
MFFYCKNQTQKIQKSNYQYFKQKQIPTEYHWHHHLKT